MREMNIKVQMVTNTTTAIEKDREEDMYSYPEVANIFQNVSTLL